MNKAKRAAIVWSYAVSLFVFCIGSKFSGSVELLGLGMMIASTGYMLLAVADMDDDE